MRFSAPPHRGQPQDWGRLLANSLFPRSLPNIFAYVTAIMGGVSVRLRILVYSFLFCLSSTLTCFAQQSSASSKLPPIPYTPGLDVTAMDKSVDPCVDFYARSEERRVGKES